MRLIIHMSEAVYGIVYTMCHLIIEIIYTLLQIADALKLLFIIIYIKFALNILTTHFHFVYVLNYRHFNAYDGYQTTISSC